MEKSKNTALNEFASYRNTVNSSLSLGILNKLLQDDTLCNRLYNVVDSIHDSDMSAHDPHCADSPVSSIFSAPEPVTRFHVTIDDVYEKLCALEYYVCKSIRVKADTNLDIVKQFNAEQLAYFIVHDAKTIISGTGDAESELAEYFKQSIS